MDPIDDVVEVRDLYNLDEISYLVDDSKIDPATTRTIVSSYITTKDTRGYFYIIKTADTPANVYKIGKTVEVDPNKRLCKYPKYSDLKYTVAVANADTFEDLVMRKLKTKVKRRQEFGLEYYEAELPILINIIHEIWMAHGSATEHKIDKPVHRSTERIKPNGWQFFVNEWLSANQSASPEEAYAAYVNCVKTAFLSNEYAEYPCFLTYYSSLFDL
jgi:predicted house-cleaning noncanonical NTP pyrophosphatase (MazG superfamily)